MLEEGHCLLAAPRTHAARRRRLDLLRCAGVRAKGKSGEFPTLIVFRAGTRAVFVHGFAKNEKDNIEKDELVALKKLADELLAYDDKTLARVLATGVLVEVKCDEETVS